MNSIRSITLNSPHQNILYLILAEEEHFQHQGNCTINHSLLQNRHSKNLGRDTLCSREQRRLVPILCSEIKDWLLTDTGEDSKLVHRRKRSKVNAAQPRYFLFFFSDASERRVWLSAESKILASTFGRFRLYRLMRGKSAFFDYLSETRNMKT